MDVKRFLLDIDATRSSRLLTITEMGRLKIPAEITKDLGGFYWIYTSYSINELMACRKADKNGAIDIGALAKLHHGLRGVNNGQIGEFRLVYNGVAKPIRSRLQQHFNGGEGTGCLAIKHTSLNDLSRWRISYAAAGLQGAHIPLSYGSQAKTFERLWRLEFGWPLLCQQ